MENELSLLLGAALQKGNVDEFLHIYDNCLPLHFTNKQVSDIFSIIFSISDAELLWHSG